MTRKIRICFVQAFAYAVFNPKSSAKIGGAEVDLYNIAIELAKECKSAGMTDLPLRAWFGFRTEGPAAAGLVKMNPNIELNEIFYRHDKK